MGTWTNYSLYTEKRNEHAFLVDMFHIEDTVNKTGQEPSSLIYSNLNNSYDYGEYLESYA